MDQFVIKSCNRSREPVSVTMPVEEDASEADRYEYHDQFSPDDYDMMEEGQNHPEERDTCNISVMDKKAILDMEKRSAKVSISSCPSTPTTEGSMTMSSSPHSLDDLQSFTQESLQGTATVTTIREGEEQVFGTGDEERSELTTEDYVEAALRQEKELSRATRLVENGAGAEQLQTRIRVFPGAVSMIPDISDGEDGLDGGVRQGIRQPTRFGSIQSGDMYTGHGNLAVASPVMEEELGETQDGNVPQAEAIVRESKMENWTCSFVLGCLLLSIVLVTGILMGVFLLPSLKVEEEGMNDLAEGSDGRPGVTFAPTTYRESLGIEEQIAVLLGASKLTNATSPHYKALQWILHDDPLQLPKTATNLVQRFILVLFYFQTTQNGPWRTCNPALLDNETHVCDFLTLRWVFPELAFDTIPANRWLSLAHECTWAGVDCEADVVIDLKLDANNLSGNLPFELGYLPELMGLSFVHNELTGILSSALALEMHRITQIQLQHNQLSGSIPPEWCQLKNVERFNLAENYLTGPLPTEIGQLGSNHNGNSLMGLFLFSNPGLTGPIPKEIGNLKSLSFLRISKTGLEGPIPTEIGELTALTELWAHSSFLSGEIPSELGQTALRHLRLQNTRINGTIPEVLYDLPLERLDLWETNLVGTISPKIGQLAETLSVLRLQNNSLTGMLPSEMGLLTLLGTLYLQQNELEGSIPRPICDKVLGRTNHAIKGNLTAELDVTANQTSRIKLTFELDFAGNQTSRGNLTAKPAVAANQTIEGNMTFELDIHADCLVSNQSAWPRVSCESGCCAVCCDSETGSCL